MITEQARIYDILTSAEALLSRLEPLSLAQLGADQDAVKATFYDVIVIGEAIRMLVGRRSPMGEQLTEDSAIITANPQIPWTGWIGMRDMITHQYFRAAPELVWRDYESGEIHKLASACAKWLDAAQSAE